MKVYPTETGVAEERTGGSLRARFLIPPAFKSLWVSMGIIIEIILIIIILQLPSRPMPLFDCYSTLRVKVLQRFVKQEEN